MKSALHYPSEAAVHYSYEKMEAQHDLVICLDSYGFWDCSIYS